MLLLYCFSFYSVISLKVLIGVLLLGKVHDYQYSEQVSSNPATGQQLKSSDSLLSHVSQSSLTEVNSPEESPSRDRLLENIAAGYTADENMLPKEELFLKQKRHRAKKPLSEIERYTLCSNRIV